MEVLLLSLLPLNTISDEHQLQDCYHVLLCIPHSILEDIIAGTGTGAGAGAGIVQSSSLPPIERCFVPREEIRLPEWTNRTTNSSRSFVQSKGCLDLSASGHLMI